MEIEVDRGWFEIDGLHEIQLKALKYKRGRTA